MEGHGVHRLTAILMWFHDPRTLRWLRPARRAGYVVALALLAWFAHARLTTLPAAYYRGHAPTPPELSLPELTRLMETYAELRRADESLRDSATDNRPSPYGRRPSPAADNLAIALKNPWDPASEDAQQSTVTYLRRPEVAAALHRLATHVNAATDALVIHGWPRERITGRGWLDDVAVAGEGQWPGVGSNDDALDDSLLALTARARVHHANDGNLAAAWDDLRTALRLGRLAGGLGYHGTPPSYDSTDFVAVPARELAQMAFEHDLPPALTADILHFLTDELGLSVGRVVLERAGFERGPDDWLDEYFTSTPRGDGWLVVSRLRAGWPDVQHRGPMRSPAWNLASPVFISRSAARADLARLIDWIAALDSTGCPGTYYYGVSGLRRVPQIGRLPSFLGETPTGDVLWGVGNAGLDVTRRRIAALAVALAAYRTEHGALPETLAALVPDYLSAVPLDPFTAHPLQYWRIGRRHCQVTFGRDSEWGDTMTTTFTRPGTEHLRQEIAP
jgi:hypothetical protein